MTQFENKVALVTGAGSGMGRSTAVLLAQRGAAVTIVGRRENKLHEVAAEIGANGGQVLAVPGDVSKPEDVARAVERFGALHNNAGVAGDFTPLLEMTPARYLTPRVGATLGAAETNNLVAARTRTDNAQ